MWHEALEEASRLYFGEHNIEGMLKALEPLHEMLEEGAMRNNTTIKERAFIEVFSIIYTHLCPLLYYKTNSLAYFALCVDSIIIVSLLISYV